MGGGLDLTKEALCTRSERVGQIYPGGDWLKGGGNTGTKVETGQGSRNLSPSGASGV